MPSRGHLRSRIRSVSTSEIVRHGGEGETGPHRHLRSERVLVQPEDILDTEELSLFALVALHTFKVSDLYIESRMKIGDAGKYIPRLEARVIPHLHLLLLVHLSRVDELLYRARAKQTVHGNVAHLAETVCTVHSLEIVSRICQTR